MLDKYSMPQKLHAKSGGQFHVMAKPAGSSCNLDCKYCFYLSKETLRNGPGTGQMSEDTLELFIRQYIEGMTGPQLVFSWQGGEPTLRGLDFYRRVVALQKKYAKANQRIENDLQTNGVLLDEEWAKFLKEHRFLVGLSVDGPRELHDQFRVNKGGAPTFDKVMAAAKLLRKFGVPFNTLTCVHRLNASRPLDVYRFLRSELNSTYIQFIPIVQLKEFETTAPQKWDESRLPIGRQPGGAPRSSQFRCHRLVRRSRRIMDTFYPGCSTSGAARILAKFWSITSRHSLRSTWGFPRSFASITSSAARASRWSTTAASIPATITSIRNTGWERCEKNR